MPAQIAPLNPTPATANQLLVEKVDGVTEAPTALFGWSLAESTGSAAAKVRLYDGTSTAGNLVAVVTFLANESKQNPAGAQSLELFNGALYLQVVSGSVEGTVYWG